ncbi:MAG: hypothetical protein H7145_12170 [Akkermansiaceae bacterium]|nr:hypothetical protein [Armatimonadota bacterium]
MELNAIASAILVIWFCLSSLALIGLLAVIAFSLAKLQSKLDEVVTKVDPLLGKADALVTLADEKLRMVGERAETLLTTGEEIATTMQTRVEQTTGTVHRTVNAPLIEVNAVASGLTRAWETFTRRKSAPVVVTDADEVNQEPQKQGAKAYGG